MRDKDQDTIRIRRYRTVLDAALVDQEFALTAIKQACRDERPAFVTRVLGDLEKEGFLARSGARSQPSFHWKRPRAAFCASSWIDAKIHATQIRRAPVADRPRERLLAHGAATLRTAELLAILIRAGRRGESALQSGEKIANRYSQAMKKLPDAGSGELRGVSPAVSEAAYCQIMAGVELGRRVAVDSANGTRKKAWRIGDPQNAMAYCRQKFARLASDAAHEEFHVVTLDTRHGVIGTHRVSKGSLNGSPAHPRDVFRPAIKDAAASVILAHNHPSGDPSPSGDDLAVTKRLEQAGEQIGIKVLDHIIVARDGVLSLAEHRTSNGR